MAMHQVTAFHIDDGATLMFPVDAAHAIQNHPHEWSRTAWTDEEADKARERARIKRETEEAARVAPKDRVPADERRLQNQNRVDPNIKPVAQEKIEESITNRDSSDLSSKVAEDNGKAVDQASGKK